jgi:hypothetical protein
MKFCFMLMTILTVTGFARDTKRTGNGGTVVCTLGADNTEDCTLVDQVLDGQTFTFPDHYKPLNFSNYPDLVEAMAEVSEAIKRRCIPYVQVNRALDLCRIADLKNYEGVLFFETENLSGDDPIALEGYDSYLAAWAKSETLIVTDEKGIQTSKVVRIIEVKPSVFFEKLTPLEQALELLHELFHFKEWGQHKWIYPFIKGLVTYFKIREQQMAGEIHLFKPEDKDLESLIELQNKIIEFIQLGPKPLPHEFRTDHIKIHPNGGGLVHRDVNENNFVSVDSYVIKGYIDDIADFENNYVANSRLTLDFRANTLRSCRNEHYASEGMDDKGKILPIHIGCPFGKKILYAPAPKDQTLQERDPIPSRPVPVGIHHLQPLSH